MREEKINVKALRVAERERALKAVSDINSQFVCECMCTLDKSSELYSESMPVHHLHACLSVKQIVCQ